MERFPETDGRYISSCETPSIIARVIPSAVFFLKYAGIVLSSSREAKRSRYGDAEWASSSHEVLTAIESVGVSLEVTGIEILKRQIEPVVFIGNHMSTFETMILPAVIEPYIDTTFVVKRSLIDTPVFRHIMRSRDPIVVDRKNPREDFIAVINQGVEILKRGRSIIIFPQTTRTTEFDPKEFNTIGIKLARKADVPVIPIALKTDAWGNGNIVKEFGRIDPSKKTYFAFGEPFRITDQHEAHTRIIEFITTKLREWGGM